MQNPNITIKQLSEDLVLSERTVNNRLNLLKKEGFIVRVGSKTSVYWEVVGELENDVKD
jgi:DNA-binding Lrp family transcriptional regulator